MKLFRSIEGNMLGHAEMNHVKGVDMSTGCLGQGFSAAVGMALAGKLGNKTYRVYVLLGEGETDEGQAWETSMAAVKYKLDNLCATVGVNGLQKIDGRTADVMPSEPLGGNFSAFGWHVIEINGNDFEQLKRSFEAAQEQTTCPSVVLAKTIKGKGVSFMGNNHGWYGKAPNDQQYLQAHQELVDTMTRLEEESLV